MNTQGLHIAVGIDMEIATTTGNAATHELAIILKIEGQQRFLVPHRMVEVIEHLALLRTRHELGPGVLAHGHVGENPGEEHALVDKPIVVLLGADRIGVLARIANGDAKGGCRAP